MKVVTRHSRNDRRRGIAAVELAFLLTFVLVPLLLGIWEVGRLVEVQQYLTNGAREGSRQASTGKKSVSQVQQSVVNYLANCGVTVATTNVTVTNLTNSSRTDPQEGTQPTNALQLDHFQVTVSVPFDNVRWVLLNKITNVTTITSTSDWYSMNDLPLTVSTTIPGMPQ